jgi:hypothetical protein
MNAASLDLFPIKHRKENTTPPTWWILLKIPSRNVLQAHRRHHTIHVVDLAKDPSHTIHVVDLAKDPSHTIHVVDLAKDPSPPGIFSKIHHRKQRCRALIRRFINGPTRRFAWTLPITLTR